MPDTNIAPSLVDVSELTPLADLFPYPNRGEGFRGHPALKHNFAVLTGSDPEDVEAHSLHQDLQRAILAASNVDVPLRNVKARLVEVHIDRDGKFVSVIHPERSASSLLADGLTRIGLYFGIDSTHPRIPHHLIEGAQALPYHVEMGLHQLFSNIHGSMMLGQSPSVLRAEAERLGGQDNHDGIGWTTRVGVFGGMTLPGID